MALKLRPNGRGYMTFAEGFLEANVTKPGALAEHVFAVGGWLIGIFFFELS